MMKVKLTDLRIYYINLHKDKAKGKATQKLLESLGFRYINRSPGFLQESFILGSGAAYQNVLCSRIDKKDPFILVEDDIRLTHFDHIIEVPDDADAIYLGVSKMGNVSGQDKEELVVSKVEGYDHIYRIYNMLATHAIVYLNMDYAKSAHDAAQRYLDKGLPHDLGIAENMKDWNVYAIDKPMFIQYPKFRYYTDTPISELENVTVIKNNKINKWLKQIRGY
jgi:hypothetical protein